MQDHAYKTLYDALRDEGAASSKVWVNVTVAVPVVKITKLSSEYRRSYAQVRTFRASLRVERSAYETCRDIMDAPTGRYLPSMHELMCSDDFDKQCMVTGLTRNVSANNYTQWVLTRIALV